MQMLTIASDQKRIICELHIKEGNSWGDSQRVLLKELLLDIMEHNSLQSK